MLKNNQNNSIKKTKLNLLLVDDDPLILDSLGFILKKSFNIIAAGTRQQAIEKFVATKEKIHVALIDLGLPPYPHKPDEGFSLIRELILQHPNIKILVLSGQDNDMNIQHALTIGAVDFIVKPAQGELLLERLQHHQRLYEIDQSRKKLGYQELVGDSVVMQALKDQIKQFASSPFPVLIEGDSGTGKELVANALHQSSTRNNALFLAVNCAAIAPDLLESQLFGHCKGAFTGAVKSHDGFFIKANNGTLLLDEIAELPINLQAKLLRVIETGEFYRVGETQLNQTKVRIITATNKKLQEEVKQNNFREDLYHRLSILNIQVPPLNQRGDDVFLLLNNFIKTYSENISHFILDEQAKKLWKNYAYPGNVRELRNIVIRLGTKYPNQSISEAQLNAELETKLPSNNLAKNNVLLNDEIIKQKLQQEQFDLDKLLKQIESHSIKIALEMHHNNVSKAAKALNIKRTTLYHRVQKLGNTE